MTKIDFQSLIEELKKQNSDYHIDLYYQGVDVGCIYYSYNLDSIDVDQRANYLLVYNDTFGLFVDDAKLHSI